MSLGVAVIGAGLMGGWHARYARHAGARLLAIVDSDPDRAAALATKLGGVRSFATADDSWLEQAKPDVVHVCTPAGSHSAIAAQALGAGCSALVEKPLAEGLLATRRLLDDAGRAGQRIAPVHQFPYQRGFRTVRSNLAQLGRLKRVDIRICSAGAEQLEGSLAARFLVDVLPHAASLVRALGLRVPPAQWRVERFDESELCLLSDCAGTSVSVWISADTRPTLNELTLYGTRGTAHVDLFHGFGFVDSAGANRASKLVRPFRWAGRQAASAAGNLARRAWQGQPAYPGLPELIAEFYQSIESGGPPVVEAEEILEIAELCERVATVHREAS